MKVSLSARPSSLHEPRSHRGTELLKFLRVSVSLWPVAVIAAAYLAAHLLSFAPSLEDIDSINFALGLRDFDVARHQPHPPGSPVYIAMGRALLAVVATVGSSLSETAAEALTLSLWSAVAAAVALVAAARIYQA